MVWTPPPSGKRGRQQSYSDAAIQVCLTMKSPFGMALRQTTGFVESLLQLIGLAWVAPDFSTLCRRQKALAVDIPYRGSPGPLHLLIDNEALSTIGPRTMPNGIKAEGEGEWQARKHGGPKAASVAQDPPRDRRGHAGAPGGRDHGEPCRRCPHAS